MTIKRPSEIDVQLSADRATEQAILRVQRTLCLMNAPHSYRLFDAATLLRQASPNAEIDDRDAADDQPRTGESALPAPQ